MSRATQWGWVALAAVCGAGIASVLVVAASYTTDQWNKSPMIENVGVTASVSVRDRHRWLQVQYHVGAPTGCPSFTQHSIYQDIVMDGIERRVVVPLGITVNGLGSPSDRADFSIPFSIPSDVKGGAWTYVAIMSTFCEWVPGLTRRRVLETPPAIVYVPKEG
jgi:hypothetical protein